MYLATVSVAETPQTEIAQIAATVHGLDTVGFIGDEEHVAMRSALDEARLLVEKNDRSGAIGKLNEFRTAVQGYHAGNVLVDEEAKHLTTEAAYVISRLGGVSSVRADEATAARASVRAIVSGETARIEFKAPAGSDVRIRIVDLRGSVLRTIRPGVASTGTREVLWDGRDDAGNTLPYGAYLLLLDADGASASARLPLQR